jgi:anti-sigma regulatory factor (Ser/Thr protein kinase)
MADGALFLFPLCDKSFTGFPAAAEASASLTHAGGVTVASNRQPLHSRCDLASSPSAVRWGRKHAAEILARWDVAEAVAEDALLIVSELLTNAVQHAVKPLEPAGGRPDAVVCSLLLWLTEKGLTVSVYDADRRPPVVRNASADAECGRGLRLVDALSEAWGYTHPSPASGKLIWARLPLPEHSTGDRQRGLQTTAASTASGAGAVRSV